MEGVVESIGLSCGGEFVERRVLVCEYLLELVEHLLASNDSNFSYFRASTYV